MRLSHILRSLPPLQVRGDGGSDPEITSLVYDSRQATPGSLFAALSGTKTDGIRFAEDAIQRGAVALLLSEDHPEFPVPRILSPSPRRTLGEIADIFYEHPSRKLCLIGITGTNGKTTTAFLIQYILSAHGFKTGLLGTILYDNGQEKKKAPLTTPESVDFTRYLAEMVAAGCQYAVVEVSSHALSQDRVAAHRFAIGIFTNLTRDHLDYHGDMESYGKAKKKLFDSLEEGALAVLNGEDPASEKMRLDCRARICRYGRREDLDVVGEVLESRLDGTRIRVTRKGKEVRIESPLVGVYNVMNVLAAIAAVCDRGLSLEGVAKAIETFPGVPGRLERIPGPDGSMIFVDYAHTDDAIRSVLRVLRPLTRGRLGIVFGCGGDRDRGKRPLMAKAAEEEADLIWVTSDNPRSESPEAIVADIWRGFHDPSRPRVILDRREAVREAIRSLREGDTLLIAGKGHEDVQIVGAERIPMRDQDLVRDALEELKRGER